MSGLSEAFARIDRARGERRQSAEPAWNRPHPAPLPEGEGTAEVPARRGVSRPRPRLVLGMGLSGVVALGFVLASHLGWARFSADQRPFRNGPPAEQATLAVAPPTPAVTLSEAKDQLRRQGAHAARSGDFEGAEATFRRLLEVEPGSAETYNNLGVLYVQSGALRQGIAALRTALRLSPEYAEAILNLAVALERQGEMAEAMTHYRRFLVLAGEERNEERKRVVRHLTSLQRREPLR